jgi:hypothetical protein
LLLCGSGETCISGRCYATGANTCGSAGLALCSSNTDCGGNRVCLNSICHTACGPDTSCPTGQVCGVSGACVEDPAPATAACLFDSDCGVAFRCINAYCHPLCSSDSQCGENSFCNHGVCRADYRPPAG